MIKIIKEGFLKEDALFKIKCTECDTEFECEFSDFRYVQTPTNEGNEIKANYTGHTECPLCKKLIHIKDFKRLKKPEESTIELTKTFIKTKCPF